MHMGMGDASWTFAHMERSISPECKGLDWCLIYFFLLDLRVDCFSFFITHLQRSSLFSSVCQKPAAAELDAVDIGAATQSMR